MQGKTKPNGSSFRAESRNAIAALTPAGVFSGSTRSTILISYISEPRTVAPGRYEVDMVATRNTKSNYKGYRSLTLIPSPFPKGQGSARQSPSPRGRGIKGEGGSICSAYFRIWYSVIDQSGQIAEIPFNRTFVLEAVDIPQSPLGKDATDVERAVYNVREAELEITEIKPFSPNQP